MEVVALFAEYKPIFAVVHVLAVVIGMGGAVVADILFAYFAYNKKLAPIEVHSMQRLARVVSIALLGILISGFTLYLSAPETYAASTKFLVKMTVVSVLIVNGLLLHRYVFTRLYDYHILTGPRRHIWRQCAVTMGAISVTSWVSALTLGVFDTITLSYAAALTVYMSAVVGGVLCALGVLRWYEHRVQGA